MELAIILFLYCLIIIFDFIPLYKHDKKVFCIYLVILIITFTIHIIYQIFPSTPSLSTLVEKLF